MKFRHLNKISIIKNKYENKKKISKCDKSNPCDIIPFKNINAKDKYISLFDFVHTYNDLYYIIYTTNFQEIVFFDIIDNKIVLKIENAHSRIIVTIKHYFDNNNKRDLLASYCYKNSIKIWNINIMECITEIDLLSSFGDILLNSLFFMNLNNQLFIVAPFVFEKKFEKIAFYDLKGVKMKEIKIKINNHNVFDTNCYYDQKAKKNYIFFGGDGYLKSFDVNKNDIYKIYCNNDGIINNQIIIYNDNTKIKLISAGGGLVRIWNFHTGNLLNQIAVTYNQKYNLPIICIWNSDYLIGACESYSVKIIDFKNRNIPQTLCGFENSLDVKKIIHPVYGECLLFLSTKGITNYLCIGINKCFL